MRRNRDYISVSAYTGVVVKDKVGRRRYIIVENSPKVREAVKKIRKFDDWGKVILCEGNFCLVRCRHWHKERAIEIMREMGIKTYRTTGTIRKAKRIISSLKI